jgi:glucose-1-phosphate thymidylyltransferase
MSMDAAPVGILVVDDQDSTRHSGHVHALEKVANQTIAHQVLDDFKSAGVREVVVACSSEHSAEIRSALAPCGRSAGLRLQYVEERGPLHLPAAMRLAAPAVGDAACIVHIAGGLLGESLAPLLDRLGGDSPDIVLIVHHGASAEGHLSPRTQEMLHLAELYPERAALNVTGVWLFGSGALRHVLATDWRCGGDLDLTAVAREICAAGGGLEVRLAGGWRRYAGDPLDLLELNRIALDRLVSDLRTPNSNGNHIEGRVRIDELASVRASVIVGPVVIGPGARVDDAYIGPYTSIGAGARIEGAEIERSIISDGASITHVGRRIVASVVGRDARVFRDFSLPRALRVRVGEGTEVGLC